MPEEFCRAPAPNGPPGPDFPARSFFDIFVDVEIHAVPNNPNMNPGTVIDNVYNKIKTLGTPPKEFVGHVSILK